MRVSRLRSALLGSGAAFILVAAATPASADDVSDLRKQINIMQEKIAKLEADKSAKAKRRVAAAVAVEAGDKPRSWKLPGTNTSMSIGGYVKADLLWDLGARGGLTVGGPGRNGNNPFNNATNGGAFQFHARQSRFFIRTWTPTDWGELATHLEGDFFALDVGGTNIAPEFRLRHAYGRLGPVLAGQTWSTWMPIFAGAETLDFGGALSAIFVRQVQVRYTHSFGGGFFMDFAVENPIRRGLPAPFGGNAQSSGNGPTFVAVPGLPPGTNVAGANHIPDFVLTAYYNMPLGRIWVGGIFRQLQYDTGTGAGADSTFGWGVAVAGAFKITKKIRAGFQGLVGRGVMSYLNGASPDAVIQTAASNGQGDLDAVLIYGGYVWGQYRWTDTIRSTVMWSYLKVDLSSSLPSGVNANTVGGTESIHQVFANLIWSPVPRVNIGIEYSFFQQNFYAGANFTGNRIHIAFQYSF